MEVALPCLKTANDTQFKLSNYERKDVDNESIILTDNLNSPVMKTVRMKKITGNKTKKIKVRISSMENDIPVDY